MSELPARIDEATGNGLSARVSAYGRPGRYDSGLRRQAKRSAREKGCWTYLPAAELVKAGIDPDGPAPFYRVWVSRKGTALVNLYTER